MNQKLDPAKRQRQMDAAVAKRRQQAAKAANRDPDAYLRSMFDQTSRRPVRNSSSSRKPEIDTNKLLRAVSSSKSSGSNRTRSDDAERAFRLASALQGNNAQFRNQEEFEKLMRSNKAFRF